MSAYRIAVILVAMILAGCGDDGVRIAKLAAENSALRQELREREAERRAELAYWEKQAALAAGCDYLLPLCPESLIEQGRVAQEGWMGGGTSVFFWLIVLGKLFGLGMLLGGLWVAVTWGWARFTAPERESVAQARLVIEEAIAQVSMAEEREAQAVARADLAESDYESVMEDLAAAKVVLATVEADIAQKQQALKDTERARAALAAAFG